MSDVRLTDPQRRMLSLLPTEYANAVPANTMARRMWPDNRHWKQYYNSGGHGANMRMLAGGMLHRLAKRGLAHRYSGFKSYQLLWYISGSGTRALESSS